MDILKTIENSNLLNNNEIRIDSAVFKKISKSISVYFVLKNTIDLVTYDSLKKLIDSEFKKYVFTKCEISIGYENDTLTEDEIKVYLGHIIEVLAKTNLRYNSFDASKAIVDGNDITLFRAVDEYGLDILNDSIKQGFYEYGLDYNVMIKVDETRRIQDQINSLNSKIDQELDRQKEEASQQSHFNVETTKKYSYRKDVPDYITPISDIPHDASELNYFQYENGMDTFKISGYVYNVEFKEFPKTPNMLANIYITDESDSIMVQKWVKDVHKEAYKKDLKINSILEVVGKAKYSSWDKQVLIDASSIQIVGIKKEEIPVEDAEEKRVELHCFTKFNNLDGLVDPEKYMDIFKAWGHKAFAIADNSGLYAASEIDHMMGKYPDIKPIFGIELPFINDSEYFITFTKEDINLKDATYVVFDIETTGFSVNYDEIIEIAAHKVEHGIITSVFESFVNPNRPIPEKITALTSITDEDVRDAEPIEEVLKKFLAFADGAILVAHNARFDVEFIYAKMKKCGMEKKVFPAIDTLDLFRAGYYNDVKKFNLKELTSYFKVKQEHHHRASDDTRVTALCFVYMLEDLYKKGIYNYKDIDSIIDPNVHYRYVIPKMVTVIAKDPKGYKNLLKLTSDAMTKHLYGSARLLKSVLDEYREGTLVSTSLERGEVFEVALNKDIEELERIIDYYDYVEILPPDGYSHHYPSLLGGKKTIEEVLKKIISVADKHNKLVVAVSGSHYILKEEKRYRDILIDAPQLGGGIHYLKETVIKDHAPAPSVHLRTTKEMLEDISFLGEEKAYEIVIKNTNIIADMTERYSIFKDETFAPHDDEFKDNLGIPSIVEEAKKIVYGNLEKKYGTKPHPIIQERLDKEMTSIINSGYMSVYYISHLLVIKSLNDGYLVGSRGSVGSSFVATMMNITEINPLAPHYYCPNCKFHVLKMTEEEQEKYGMTEEEAKFQDVLKDVDSGYDLPDMVCPHCGGKLKKDGHDIPFETFLGYGGGKEPDIDLNFSGDYQAKAHEYIREVFGPENAFRAGTIQTLADKNAYGYVKGYCERNNISLRDCEIDRISQKLVGIKRSTGQHPGGIVVVPHYVDIYDVTAVQYPADNIDSTWRTTHYDYHKFEKNLLKFDILGHDDPTIIKFFMDYVKEHQEDYHFTKPEDIPVDDPKVYQLFSSTDCIGLKPDDIESEVASYAIPEFGTDFVNNMLIKTKPKTFAELVKISGLSHGTNVWNSNAEDLVTGVTEYGNIEFKKIIGCRDDIMVQLMEYGLEPKKSFDIMEFVRKGKFHKGEIEKWGEYKEYMRSKGVPEWYIWSCQRIEYMFPKAHATAYVLMALRIAWFKVYSPLLFYSAWFSKRANAHEIETYVAGPFAIVERIRALVAKPKNARTAKEDDLITALRVALEMTKRGFKFLPIDINKSEATIFKIEENGLRIPFTAEDGLGEAVAYTIIDARNERPFTSKKDIKNRTKLSQTLFDKFNLARVFGNLPDQDKLETDGIFGLDDNPNTLF